MYLGLKFKTPLDCLKYYTKLQTNTKLIIERPLYHKNQKSEKGGKAETKYKHFQWSISMRS